MLDLQFSTPIFFNSVIVFMEILLLIGVVILFFYLHHEFKIPKFGCMTLVTGGVKTGKSTLSVYMAIKRYKRNKRQIRFLNILRKIIFKPALEEPLLYSNIPLGVPYVKLTKKLIERKARFRYGSVIYINEASLFADSQMIKDMDLNERLLMFNKLIGHELLGGYIIYDTQAIVDVHYSIKRCLSNYFYIHHLTKWIPGFLIAHVRECVYSEDGSVTNVHDKDVEEDLKRVLIPKCVWKKFDAYCYSFATDSLPVYDKVQKPTKDMKVKQLVSFNDERRGYYIAKTND